MLLLRGATAAFGVISGLFSFQYMLLLRGATLIQELYGSTGKFQYMLLLRGATPAGSLIFVLIPFQYMLLLRGATRAIISARWFTPFQYMLLLRGATFLLEIKHNQLMFQYMLLLRGATSKKPPWFALSSSFNTCSSCEEQPEVPLHDLLLGPVSIHAPLARSNKPVMDNFAVPVRFQYMLLLRGATACNCLANCRDVGFNTCSSCEEQHLISSGVAFSSSFNTCSSCEEQHRRNGQGHCEHCFNTCSSCEEQPSAICKKSRRIKFQYMLLLRGATPRAATAKPDKAFQYMLLLRGATSCDPRERQALCFNTCSSCEEQPIRRGCSA